MVLRLQARNPIDSGTVVRECRAFGLSVQLIRGDAGGLALWLVRIDEIDDRGMVSGPMLAAIDVPAPSSR
ncbi:MAG: hypothetical protein ACF8LK_00315 [Phycisphaerales bacterium JB041]